MKGFGFIRHSKMQWQTLFFLSAGEAAEAKKWYSSSGSLNSKPKTWLTRWVFNAPKQDSNKISYFPV